MTGFDYIMEKKIQVAKYVLLACFMVYLVLFINDPDIATING
jgi:hypothetical protein